MDAKELRSLLGAALGQGAEHSRPESGEAVNIRTGIMP